MFGIFIFFPKRFLDMTADIIINLIVSMNTYKPFKEWNRCSLMLFVWFWFLVDGFFVYVCEVLFIIFFFCLLICLFLLIFVCLFFFVFYTNMICKNTYCQPAISYQCPMEHIAPREGSKGERRRLSWFL